MGFVEAATENKRVCRGLIDDLIRRGLRYDQGLLVVVDGLKGLLCPVKKALKGYVRVHRCQWHKRENVVSYLPQSQRPRIRRKLQRAYDHDTYEAAKAALQALKPELRLMNGSALASLEEGLPAAGRPGGNPDAPPTGNAPGPETQLPHHELHRGTQQHGRGPHAKGQMLDSLPSKTSMDGSRAPGHSTSNEACQRIEAPTHAQTRTQK